MDALTDDILGDWDKEVPPEVLSAARACAACLGDSVQGVIFYGSCLRTGKVDDQILDFYIIVDSYKAAYGKRFLRLLNALIPPNVFYLETVYDAKMLRSKFAVLSVRDLEKMVCDQAFISSVWARFSQPTACLLARDDATRYRLAKAMAAAATRMLSSVTNLCVIGASANELWATAFTQSYASELRSEKAGQAAELFMADKARYERITPLVMARLGLAMAQPPMVQPPRGPRLWANVVWGLRKVLGKSLSLVRLIKASLTFDGGMDYLAWKISRHSGRAVHIAPWMRRLPIIGAPYLALRLRLTGAFR